MAGSIQGDINQMIGMVGALEGLSGVPQRRAAKKAEIEKEKAAQAALDKQVEVTSKAVDKASKDIDIGNPMIPENDVYIDTLKNAELARKAQFERNPSEDTYDKYLSALTSRTTASSDLENARSQWADLVSKQKQAMDDMESKKGAKATQRRNFMSYLAQQSTSLGGTVGDLPMSLQKQIASQYSKSQRKTMMDRMDKEAKNGKQ